MKRKTANIDIRVEPKLVEKIDAWRGSECRRATAIVAERRIAHRGPRRVAEILPRRTSFEIVSDPRAEPLSQATRSGKTGGRQGVGLKFEPPLANCTWILESPGL